MHSRSVAGVGRRRGLGSIVVSILFTISSAADAGPQTATVTATSNDPDTSSVHISVAGIGSTGKLVVVVGLGGTSIDFGPVLEGSSVTRTFTLTNAGDATVTNITAVVSPANVGYSIDPPLPSTLSAPGFSILTARFAPQSASDGGPATVTFTGTSGSPSEQTSVQLTLDGSIQPSLTIMDSPAFPDTFRNPGDQAPVRSLKVQNTSGAMLRVSAMVTNDTDVWQLVSEAQVEISAGAMQEFLVRFSPKVAGSAPPAKLRLVNVDSNQTLISIDLHGQGRDRNVQLLPEVLQLRITAIGRPVTVDDALVVASNDETHTFQIRAIELDEASPFTIEDPGPDLELPALSERRFAVTFTPKTKGKITAKARLYLDMDPTMQHEVTLEGTAVFVDAHGGGGCAAGGAGGSAGAAALTLAAALARRLRRR